MKKTNPSGLTITRAPSHASPCRRAPLKRLPLACVLPACVLPVCVIQACLGSTDAGEGSRRPNIVFIFVDDMGYGDLSCFGNQHVKTPNIDRLAEEGIRLTNFYVNSPICSPSRVAVTTGQYPARWKIYSYLNSRAANKRRRMRDYLDQAAPTTAKKVQAAGYATAHFGKWHMGGGRDVDDAPLPKEYGFDESLVAFEGLGDRLLSNPNNSSVKLGRGKITFCKRWEKTQKYTDRAIDFIRRHKDRPFYVRLFPNDVHDPHVPQPGSEKPWDNATTNPWERKFFAVLQELDRQVGRLVAEIDRLGLAENTLIVLTSDNGPTDWPSYYRQGSRPPGSTGPFFGRKWSLFEGGIRMPLIARLKGTIPAGAIDRRSVLCGIDLSPTFCKFAGLGSPGLGSPGLDSPGLDSPGLDSPGLDSAGREKDSGEGLDGLDRSEVLLGRPSPRAKPLFWQYGPPHAVLRPGHPEHQSPSFAIRDGSWKLLINPDGSQAQLFNLAEDPGEQTNLLDQQPELVAALTAKIKVWAQDVGLAFDDQVTPRKPTPSLSISVNKRLLRFQNRGVTLDQNGRWHFNGKACLELPRQRAPKISKAAWIRLGGTIEPQAQQGVILAHGGDKSGYSVYLKGGKLYFATCVNWQRTVISSKQPLGDGPHSFEAFWQASGSMQLTVDKQVSRGQAPGMLQVEPGDSIQIGADLTKPVGRYTPENHFEGSITELFLNYLR